MQKKPKRQGPKTRRASARDREAAAKWAAAYRQRIPCVQVGIADDGLVPLDGDDLATLLEEFARDGTFCPLRFNVNLLNVKREFAEVRARGVSEFDAALELGERHGVHESTIKRHVKSRSGTT